MTKRDATVKFTNRAEDYVKYQTFVPEVVARLYVRREDTPFLKDYEKMLQRFGTDYFNSSHRSTK